VISPSFQWVGLRLFVRLAEPTGSARPARRGRQRYEQLRATNMPEGRRLGALYSVKK
jgi:hypothetical protein